MVNVSNIIIVIITREMRLCKHYNVPTRVIQQHNIIIYESAQTCAL